MLSIRGIMTLAKQPNPRLKADVENARLSGSLVATA
jgi:hypothetical protein